jgi:phage terminase small subunit
MKTPAAPAGLSAEARKLWDKILREMGAWEDSQLWIIRTGLEQWDIMQAARARVKKDGQMERPLRAEQGSPAVVGDS